LVKILFQVASSGIENAQPKFSCVVRRHLFV
jgi:hypothetical protein